MVTKNTHFDIIIVGASMAGLCCANAFANQGVSIAIIDPNLTNSAYRPAKKTSFTAEVCAINRASENFLHSINIWKNIHDLGRVCAYTNMQVTDNNHNKIEFQASTIGQTNLGNIIPNHDLRVAAYQTMKTFKNIQRINETVTHINQDQNQVTITLSNHKTIQAYLLIATDGANSWIQKKFAFSKTKYPYQQTALVAIVHHQKSHAQTARQQFLTTGPIALLPLHHLNHSAMIWSINNPDYQKILTAEPKTTMATITDIFKTSLGLCQFKDKPHHFPLCGHHVDQYFKQRVVLVGDSAHRIHPLAGLGFNLALADIKALVHSFSTQMNFKNMADLSSILSQYQRERKGKNAVMLTGVQQIKSIFQWSNPSLSFTRKQGLKLLNNLPCLKNQIIAYALGL